MQKMMLNKILFGVILAVCCAAAPRKHVKIPVEPKVEKPHEKLYLYPVPYGTSCDFALDWCKELLIHQS